MRQNPFNTLQSEWQVLSHDYNIVTNQLNGTKKQLLIAEEAHKFLEKESKALKENTANQLNYLKDQDEKNRVLFKEQIEIQEKKSQERYNLLKNESLHEKAALQKMIEKLNEQRKSLESQLHQNQIEIEQSRGDICKLEEVLLESKNQEKILKQENRELIIQIRDKDNQLSQRQNDVNALQQQLQSFQQKIDVLHEEKLILTQEKFQLEKDIQKRSHKAINKKVQCVVG